MDEIHVAIKAEEIGTVFGIPITNTLLTSWLVVAGLAVFAIFFSRRVSLVPGKFQAMLECVVEYVYSYMEEVLESKVWARKFFPLIMTLFVFIFIANLVEFTPGIGSIFVESGGGHGEAVPLFRSVNTDLNMTLALALISFFVVEFAGVAALGFLKYAGKFVNFKSVLGFIIGLIELISEVARLIAFSFRLFGNIFAGEVLILVVAFFVPLIVPVPLMLFEVFVGFIQAAIFALLTLFFLKIAIIEPDAAH